MLGTQSTKQVHGILHILHILILILILDFEPIISKMTVYMIVK